jgi:N-acyl-D-aspartate/D-glutamate deacylase
MFDLIVRGGRIVDGSGGSWFRGDVGIIGDRIAALGTLVPPAADHDESDPRANAVVDAAGLVVAPGFVDFHSHSDVSVLADPRAESAVRQGITTQLVGNCGFSAAPVKASCRQAYRRDGLMYSHTGYDWDWSTIAEYRQRLAEARPAINVLTLVGHNTLRAAVIGQLDRLASDQELASMRRLLEQALADGAVGLSSGLTYTPGSFADTRELPTWSRRLTERDSERGWYFLRIAAGWYLGIRYRFRGSVSCSRRDTSRSWRRTYATFAKSSRPSRAGN